MSPVLTGFFRKIMLSEISYKEPCTATHEDWISIDRTTQTQMIKLINNLFDDDNSLIQSVSGKKETKMFFVISSIKLRRF